MRNKRSFVGEGGHQNYVHAFKFQAQHGANSESNHKATVCIQVLYFTGSMPCLNTWVSIIWGLVFFFSGDCKLGLFIFCNL